MDQSTATLFRVQGDRGFLKSPIFLGNASFGKWDARKVANYVNYYWVFAGAKETVLVSAAGYKSKSVNTGTNQCGVNDTLVYNCVGIQVTLERA